MPNEIRVTVTGDDELSDVIDDAAKAGRRSIDGLADAADDAAKRMGRDFDGAFDSLGEGAGGAEQKFIGLKDSITGTQDVMAGLKNGDVLTLAQGLADLAGAAEALWASVGKVVVKLWAKVSAMAADAASTIASTAATVAHTVATYAAEAAAKAWAAAQWLLNAAMSANPIALVVIAIAALVAAFILAWQHSETFREIVTGAFNLVLDVVQAVWHWVSDNWPLLLAILTGPIGLAVLTIINHWDTIKDGVTGVYNWVKDKLTMMGDFIKGLPGEIASAAAGMFDGIKDAFRSAVNWIIDKWNGLSFGIPGFDPPGPGPSFPGVTIRVPQIPRLARGGIVTRPTLAVIGDGGPEAVVPLNRGGGLGAPVIIQAQVIERRQGSRAVTRGLEEAYRRGLLPRPRLAS